MAWSATVHGSMLYFTADEPGYGAELWRTDGTPAGTQLAADVATAFSSSAPLLFPSLGSELLFLASTHIHGYQLHRYVCGPPASLAAFAGPSPVTAGNVLSFTVMPSSSEAFCYGGTVSVTSTDPAAELPASHTFAQGETQHTFEVRLKTAGTWTVTGSDGTRTVNLNVTVKAAAPDGARSTILAAQPNAVAGQPVTITVRVEDVYGNAVTNATIALQTTHGTVTSAVNQNNGTYTATLSASTAGTATVSATANGIAITTTATVTFAPATGATTVTATATSTTSVVVSWTAALHASVYDLYLGNTRLGSFGGLSVTVGNLTPATAYVFRVQPRTGAASGPMSAPDLATTAAFTDAPLVAGVTKVKAVHFTELLTVINSLRAAVSLPPATLRDLTGAHVLAADVQTLRDAMSAARTALGLTTAWTDPSLSGGVIRAVHVEELRSAMR